MVDAITVTTDRLWPVRPKPLNDELLSSWLVRIANAHELKLHTFCASVWGRGKNIWNRDIDKMSDDVVVRSLARGTGVSLAAAFSTTLVAYNDWIYQEHNARGNTKWILPLGIYHRLRRGFGIQYCPKCLQVDAVPYFRRRWRLGFVTTCVDHNVQLLDRCPKCLSPVCFHRRDMGNKSALSDGNIHWCHNCNQDLGVAHTISIPAEEMLFHKQMQSGLLNGWMTSPDGAPVYAHLYFDVLHQILKLMISARARGLGQAIADAMGIEPVNRPEANSVVEFLNVEDRRFLLLQAKWLLEDWPDRFAKICRDNRIWSAWILRDMRAVPFWFGSVVQRELYIRSAPIDDGYLRKWKRYKAGLARNELRSAQQSAL